MADPPLQDPSNKPRRNKYALVCSLLSSLTGILPGYYLGIWSEKAAIKAHDDFNLSFEETLVLIIIIILYFLLGVAARSLTTNLIGRRYSLVFATAIFFGGSTLSAFSTDYVFLMAASFLVGIGAGYAIIVSTLYTAEISPVDSRGFLTSLSEVSVSVGELFGDVSGYGFSKLPTRLGWRFMVGTIAVPSIFICIGHVIFLPESPYWLVKQGRFDEAKQVLDKTSDSIEQSHSRLSEIRDAPVPNSIGSLGAWKELLLHPTPSIRHILITSLGIHFFRQASGMITLNYFSSYIFVEAGVKNDTYLQLISVAIGLTGIIFSLIATFLVDKVGRRILLLYSVGGMVFSQLGLAIGFTIQQKRYSDQKIVWASICITCALLFVAFFSVGIGPIALVYSSEVFPLRVREQGSSMAVGINIITTLIVSIPFQRLILFNRISPGGAFFLYTGIAVVSWIFFYFFLPETKGKSLEEMETLFIGLGRFCKDRVRDICELFQNFNCGMILDVFFLYTLYNRFHVSLL